MAREDGLKRRMSDRHEEWMADTFGGRVSRGSGNQPNSPMDVRQHHRDHEFAFAFEGKSTRGKGITVTEELWDKAADQAIGERPVLGLRWYHDDRLRSHTDLLVISPDDFHELVEAARQYEKLKRTIKATTLGNESRRFVPHPDDHQ
jgi:hypothetical protein